MVDRQMILAKRDELLAVVVLQRGGARVPHARRRRLGYFRRRLDVLGRDDFAVFRRGKDARDARDGFRRADDPFAVFDELLKERGIDLDRDRAWFVIRHSCLLYSASTSNRRACRNLASV